MHVDLTTKLNTTADGRSLYVKNQQYRKCTSRYCHQLQDGADKIIYKGS